MSVLGKLTQTLILCCSYSLFSYITEAFCLHSAFYFLSLSALAPPTTRPPEHAPSVPPVSGYLTLSPTAGVQAGATPNFRCFWPLWLLRFRFITLLSSHFPYLVITSCACQLSGSLWIGSTCVSFHTTLFKLRLTAVLFAVFCHRNRCCWFKWQDETALIICSRSILAVKAEL